MKDLQKIKLSEDYPVIIDGVKQTVIPAFTNGQIVKVIPPNAIVKFGVYSVVVKEDHLLSPSIAAKKAGHSSLKSVSKKLGYSKSGHPKVSVDTLRNWFFNKYEVFDAVINGLGKDNAVASSGESAGANG